MRDVMAASRRDDPGFLQVSGYISKEIALTFKAQCTMKEISQSEALEQAIKDYLAKQK